MPLRYPGRLVVPASKKQEADSPWTDPRALLIRRQKCGPRLWWISGLAAHCHTLPFYWFDPDGFGPLQTQSTQLTLPSPY